MMNQNVSVVRTITESWTFVPGALVSTGVGAALYVVASAAWTTLMLEYVLQGVGPTIAFLLGIAGLLGVWSIWLSQLVRSADGEAGWLPHLGRSELFLWLSMVAFMPVMIFAFLSAFAVAAMLAGSILTALEIDPDTLNWEVSNWGETAKTLGPAGVVVAVVMGGVMVIAPLVLLVRTVAFRVEAVREARFIVFAPGQRTRGQAMKLLVAALATFLVPGAVAVWAVNEVSLGNPYLNQIVRFAAFVIPAVAFVGYARSVERQTRTVAVAN